MPQKDQPWDLLVLQRVMVKVTLSPLVLPALVVDHQRVAVVVVVALVVDHQQNLRLVILSVLVADLQRVVAVADLRLSPLEEFEVAAAAD